MSARWPRDETWAPVDGQWGEHAPRVTVTRPDGTSAGGQHFLTVYFTDADKLAVECSWGPGHGPDRMWEVLVQELYHKLTAYVGKRPIEACNLLAGPVTDLLLDVLKNDPPSWMRP